MGKGVLIDTDVLIEYVKGNLELPEVCYISEITLYEFLRGVSDQRTAKKILEEEFIVIWNDNEIIERASRIYRDLKTSDDLLSDADLIIASTAIVKGLRLFTKNRKHFEKLTSFGLEFFEPWH